MKNRVTWRRLDCDRIFEAQSEAVEEDIDEVGEDEAPLTAVCVGEGVDAHEDEAEAVDEVGRDGVDNVHADDYEGSDVGSDFDDIFFPVH